MIGVCAVSAPHERVTEESRRIPRKIEAALVSHLDASVIETQAKRQIGTSPGVALDDPIPAGARVSMTSVGSKDAGFANLRPRAATGVDTTGSSELFQSRFVAFDAKTLSRDSIPIETQPSQIRDHRFDVALLGSLAIEIFESKQHF